jgi:hypothetical protein
LDPLRQGLKSSKKPRSTRLVILSYGVMTKERTAVAKPPDKTFDPFNAPQGTIFEGAEWRVESWDELSARMIRLIKAMEEGERAKEARASNVATPSSGSEAELEPTAGKRKRKRKRTKRKVEPRPDAGKGCAFQFKREALAEIDAWPPHKREWKILHGRVCSHYGETAKMPSLATVRRKALGPGEGKK